MARIDFTDVGVGAGVGVFNRFGPDLLAKIPAVGQYTSYVVDYGPAAAGLLMTVLDWGPRWGSKLILAGMPQATEALLLLAMPPTAARGGGAGAGAAEQYRRAAARRAAVAAAPEPRERRGL